MCSGGITTRAPTGLSHRTTVQTARPTVHPAGRDLPGSASHTNRSVRIISLMNPHSHRRMRLSNLRNVGLQSRHKTRNRPLRSRSYLAHHLRNQAARLQYSYTYSYTRISAGTPALRRKLWSAMSLAGVVGPDSGGEEKGREEISVYE
jgi:hypothetical protein